MKTIEEIRQEIADEGKIKEEPVINHEPDKELIEIRKILVQAIEEKVKEALKKDPDIIDIDICIDIWKVIKNYILQTYMREYSDKVFKAVIKEIKAAGYTNITYSCPALKDPFAFSNFYLSIMSHNIPEDNAKTYRKMVKKEAYANEGATLLSIGTIFFGLVLFLTWFEPTTAENIRIGIAFLSKIVIAGIPISIISILKYRKAKKARENMQEQILEKYRR